MTTAELFHLRTCTLCARRDRPTAYQRLGEPHPIPALHASGWIAEDLQVVLDRLAPHDVVVLDYGTAGRSAPRLRFRRTEHAVIMSVDRAAGAVTVRVWPATPTGLPLSGIVASATAVLRTCRRATRLLAVPPAPPARPGRSQDAPAP